MDNVEAVRLAKMAWIWDSFGSKLDIEDADRKSNLIK